MLFYLVSFILSIPVNMSVDFSGGKLSLSPTLFSLPKLTHFSRYEISNLIISRSWNHFLFSSHSLDNHAITLSKLNFKNFITKPFVLTTYETQYIGRNISSLFEKKQIVFKNNRYQPIRSLTVLDCNFVNCEEQIATDQPNDFDYIYCGGVFYIRGSREGFTCTFNNTLFDQCRSFFRGGALYITFQDGSATSRMGTVSITFCNFTNCSIGVASDPGNTNLNSGGYGGATAILFLSDVRYEYVNVLDTDASNKGNRLYQYSTFFGHNSRTSLTHVTFQTSYTNQFDVCADFSQAQTAGILGEFSLTFQYVCFASSVDSSVTAYNDIWPETIALYDCHFNIPITFPSNVFVLNSVNALNTDCGLVTPTQSAAFSASNVFSAQTLPFTQSQLFTVAAASSGLSPGGIAGIVIACLVILAIIALLLFLFLRHKPKAFIPPKADPAAIDGYDLPSA